MNWLVIPIIFFAIFIQTLIGFGSALIAMPLLIVVVGLDTAAPAFALAVQVSYCVLMIRYRYAFDWQQIWRLVLPALLCIPFGVWMAKQVDKDFVMLVLGIVTTGYALYALIGRAIPPLKHPVFAFLMGGLAGLLQGAYNTSGPPLVIYGTSQQWSPDKFKAQLQTLFFLEGAIAILSHLFAGNITTAVIQNALLMLPGLAAGSLLGFILSRFIQPELFRKAVLVLLLFLGLRMIF